MKVKSCVIQMQKVCILTFKDKALIQKYQVKGLEYIRYGNKFWQSANHKLFAHCLMTTN